MASWPLSSAWSSGQERPAGCDLSTSAWHPPQGMDQRPEKYMAQSLQKRWAVLEFCFVSLPVFGRHFKMQ